MKSTERNGSSHKPRGATRKNTTESSLTNAATLHPLRPIISPPSSHCSAYTCSTQAQAISNEYNANGPLDFGPQALPSACGISVTCSEAFQNEKESEEDSNSSSSSSTSLASSSVLVGVDQNSSHVPAAANDHRHCHQIERVCASFEGYVQQQSSWMSSLCKKMEAMQQEISTLREQVESLSQENRALLAAKASSSPKEIENEDEKNREMISSKIRCVLQEEVGLLVSSSNPEGIAEIGSPSPRPTLASWGSSLRKECDSLVSSRTMTLESQLGALTHRIEKTIEPRLNALWKEREKNSSIHKFNATLYEEFKAWLMGLEERVATRSDLLHLRQKVDQLYLTAKTPVKHLNASLPAAA